MNQITSYLISLAVTLTISILVTLLLRSALWRVLVDLCGTQERAQFWTIFSMIILIAIPVVIGMGYTPQAARGNDLFFEMARQLRGNFFGYLFALTVIGGFVSIFALFAPRVNSQSKTESANQ